MARGKSSVLERYSATWRSGAWNAVPVSQTMSESECTSGDDPGTDGTATDHASTGELLEIIRIRISRKTA